MIIEKISGNAAQMNLSGWKIHIVQMTRADMDRTHQRFKTEDDTDVAISLDESEVLHDNDVLSLDHQEAVIISAASEKVFCIKPDSPVNWGKICYNIGNMHQKAYLTDDCIMVPYSETFQHILQKLDAPFSVEMRKITGESANISQYEHDHRHA